MEETVFDNFDLYIDRKVDPENDYELMDPNIGVMLPTDATPFTEEEEELCEVIDLLSEEEIAELKRRAMENDEVCKVPGVRVMKDELLRRYHPDKMDVRDFWALATTYFPYYSIAGGQANCKSGDQCNRTTINMAWNLGPLQYFGDYINDECSISGKVLEIGPGYGGVCNWLEQSFPLVHYYGIDVNLLFEHPQLHQTDGRSIPNVIPNNLDAVYSYNVFQHLSKTQRTDYYKAIWDKLKDDGHFYFGMFLWTEENKNRPVWGVKDEDGRYYCGFFKQYTAIDTEEEIHAELKEIGFEVEDITKHPDKHHYHSFKCVKRV